MLAAVAFAILPVRIKELVYGNIQQGDDLVKGIQAWMLTPVFKIHDRAWGTVYKLCKIFLRPTFRLSFALDLKQAMTISQLFAVYCLPTLPGDILKCLVCASISGRLRAALSDKLPV